MGNYEEGIFISGTNGHLLKKQGIISVKDLIAILTGQKKDPTLQ